jgi:predicted GTPase
MSSKNNNNNKKSKIFDALCDELIDSDLPESEKNRRLSALLKASSRSVNLMLVGASSVGKSSTINALFDMSVAKVGVGVDPETKEIVKYELGNLTIWDTPGLGDGVEEDKTYVQQIVHKLSETGDDGTLLIDLVMVVLDAGSKDMAVSFDVINNALIPCLGEGNKHRILIALNQSDMAMKGRHWDYEKNEPEPRLQEFLAQKSESVKRRIHTATSVTVEPVCYCAGYTEDNGEKQNPYNLSKLLYYILMAVPADKRLALVDNLNATEENWADCDDEMDYAEAIEISFLDSLLSTIGVGVEKGAYIGGCALGVPGAIVGGLLGGIVGGLHGLVVKPLAKLRT